MTLSENDFRRRLIAALERIADALEAANAADPVQAIAAVLEAEREKDDPTEDARSGIERDMLRRRAQSEEFIDLPPAQRRALGLE